MSNRGKTFNELDQKAALQYSNAVGAGLGRAYNYAEQEAFKEGYRNAFSTIRAQWKKCLINGTLDALKFWKFLSEG